LIADAQSAEVTAGLSWAVIGVMFIKRHKRMARARRLLQRGQVTTGMLVRLARQPAAAPAKLTINGIPIFTHKVDKANDASLVRYDYCINDQSFTDYAANKEFQTAADGTPIAVVYDPADPSVSYPVRTIMGYYIV
jgi:hypothetical protein